MAQPHTSHRSACKQIVFWSSFYLENLHNHHDIIALTIVIWIFEQDILGKLLNRIYCARALRMRVSWRRKWSEENIKCLTKQPSKDSHTEDSLKYSELFSIFRRKEKFVILSVTYMHVDANSDSPYSVYI